MLPTAHLDGFPLVSVIIPCYNHGLFLHEAIASVLAQSYPAIEIVVVDDGSTDNTRKVAEQCKEVKYVYQRNQGLSAARNTGIAHSTGEYLVFLDADDWLLPGAIVINARHLTQNKELAFVSGGHDKVFVEEGATREDTTVVTADHYLHLLKGNYIGMHATVMYRRSVFDEMLFDTSLRNCEDYDLYLKVARKYPVYHHTDKIAAYRLHSSNMSANIPGMLKGVLGVLERQKSLLKGKREKQSYEQGKANWKRYYCKELYRRLKDKRVPSSAEILDTFFHHKPWFFFKYILKRRNQMIKAKVKELTPSIGLKWLHKMGVYDNYLPAVGEVELGNFNRPKPFSTAFGYDRGGPVDRYYIENFLTQESDSIQGRVLEIGDNDYTMRYGGIKVTQSDILHVNESNPSATFIGDISDAPHIPDRLFDCIVLTQTLHLIYDFKGALNTCYRILKPGGVLLLTVPGITPIDYGEWKDTWYWSFTDKSMQKLMAETFPAANTEIRSYGNVMVATAFLYGMGLQEVPKKSLDYQDPRYQVIVSVKAQKASER